MTPDIIHMQHALALGRRGLGQTWPNPSVGCVIVSGSRVIGRGWTQPGGRPHAEAMALEQAGDAARGATAYVTLEPCAHYGKTPPCALALSKAGIARVVSTVEDPDPRVAGKGFEILRQAGITVETGLLVDQARAVNVGFLSRMERGRPHLTLKLASSFDGRIATASGESQWITGPQARAWVHAERMRADAVLVGAGTARADDPMLTVRGMGAQRQPVRIVASRRLDLPLDSQLSRSAHQVPLWLCHGPDASPERINAWTGIGATCLQIAAGPDRRIAPEAMLAALAEQGLTRVFCEGGGMLAATLLNAGLVDRLVGFTAGLALGAEGQPSLGPMGLGALKEAPGFALTSLQQIGADVLHIWEAGGERTRP